MAAISKTVLKVKPGKVQEVVKQLNSASDRASGIEGLNGFGFAVTGNDEITAFGVYDSVAASESAASLVSAVFSELGPMISEPPQRGVFEGSWFSM